LMRLATAPRRLRGRARMAPRSLPPDDQARLRRLRAGRAAEPVSDEGGEAAP
jgi:hypothetical protein